MKKLFAIILMLLSSSLYAKADNQEYLEMVKEGKAVVIDVREKNEVEEGVLNGAIWLPLSSMKSGDAWVAKVKELTKDKTALIYCRSGNRAGIAEKMFENKGIEAENIGGYENLKPTFGSTKEITQSIE